MKNKIDWRYITLVCLMVAFIANLLFILNLWGFDVWSTLKEIFNFRSILIGISSVVEFILLLILFSLIGDILND